MDFDKMLDLAAQLAAAKIVVRGEVPTEDMQAADLAEAYRAVEKALDAITSAGEPTVLAL